MFHFSSLLRGSFFLVSTLSLAAEVQAFQKGDRVTFIGDSITHGGSYHSNVYLFYATRFPTQNFSVYNCGISGDTAVGTNIRFNQDIAIHEPNVATIMLGMNDAWAWCFEKNPPTESMLAGRQNALATYRKEMNALTASLKKRDCRVIFIKPSIYDQTAELPEKNLVGKNDLLATFSGEIDEMAKTHGATVIDFHSLMSEVNARVQKDKPSATIIGKDRVHPGDAGHFVMTYAFLKTQEMPSLVSSIELDAGAGEVTALKNCSLAAGAKLMADTVSFTCTEQALPFPVSESQQKALEWVPFQKDLNQQIIRVTNLKEGSYDLKIDDSLIGKFPAKELSKGLNLAAHSETPQYQQALQVKALNDERRAVTGKLRSIAHVRFTMLAKIKPAVSEDDPEALKAALEAHVEKSKGQPWYGYVKTQAKVFLASVKEEKKLKAREEELMKKLWTINRPKPHRWSLERAAND